MGLILLLSFGILFSGIALNFTLNNPSQNTTDREQTAETEAETSSGVISNEEHEQGAGYSDSVSVEQSTDESYTQNSPDVDNSASASNQDPDGTGEADVDNRVEDLELLVITPDHELQCLHTGSSELPVFEDPVGNSCKDMSLITPTE